MKALVLAILGWSSPSWADDLPAALPADAAAPPAGVRASAGVLTLHAPVQVTTTSGEVWRGLLSSRSGDELRVVVDGQERSFRFDRLAAVGPLDVAWPPASMSLVDGKVQTSSGLVVRWKDAVPLLQARPASRAQLDGYRAMQTGGVVLVATGGAVAVGSGFATLLEALVEWSWRDLQSPWVALGGAATATVGAALLATSGAQKHRAVEAYATPLVVREGGGVQVHVVF